MAVEYSITTKICTKCGVEKELSEFKKSKLGKFGISSECRCCLRDRDRRRIRDPEKSKSSVLKARAKNPERVRATAAAYYLKNYEKERARRNAWKKLNKEKVRLYGQNREARRRVNNGSLSINLIEKLIHLQKGKCACCGKPLGDDFHMDHIFPIALGGLNVDGNIQLLRKKCNLQKSDKHPIEFMQSRGFLL